jgi:hypothetical protein
VLLLLFGLDLCFLDGLFLHLLLQPQLLYFSQLRLVLIVLLSIIVLSPLEVDHGCRRQAKGSSEGLHVYFPQIKYLLVMSLVDKP